MAHCCERCRHWGDCETKWYRGERHEEQICCNKCEFLNECNPTAKTRRSAKTARKKEK